MNAPTPTVLTGGWPVAWPSARCALLGHKVHHTRIASDARTPCARCGAAILDQGKSVSHVAHTLSCFLGKHHYIPIATRAAHHEYFCERCGHSLLFEITRDQHTGDSEFKKRVNYACGLVGHHVHVVAKRANATEYACLCGHSFVKAEEALTFIRHPLACVTRGHFVSHNETRGNWAEFVCQRCGHPFYFRLAALVQARSERQQGSNE